MIYKVYFVNEGVIPQDYEADEIEFLPDWIVLYRVRNTKDWKPRVVSAIPRERVLVCTEVEEKL